MRALSVTLAISFGICVIWTPACQEETPPAPVTTSATAPPATGDEPPQPPAPTCDPQALVQKIQEAGRRAMLEPEQARQAAGLVQRASRCAGGDGLMLAASDLFKRPNDKATFAIMRQSGLPALRSMVDRSLAGVQANPDQADGLLAGLEVLAVYGSPDDLPRIQRAVEVGPAPDERRWSDVLIRGLSRHPALARILLDNPGAELPPGFIGASLLGLANRLMAQGKLPRHPFDTPEGLARLAPWIQGEPPPNHSWRVTAVSSLAYMKTQDVTGLLQAAEADPNLRIQTEAAWVRAKRGQTRGLDRLQSLAADPRSSKVASAYLQELGQAQRIPAKARETDFIALAEFATWLSRPGEFNRPPLDIRQVDARSLRWPPTGDTRSLRVFHYRYPAIEGYGVVGGPQPFSMHSDDGPLLAKLTDIYAMACCHQLKEAGDPRGQDCDLARGRQILGFSQ